MSRLPLQQRWGSILPVFLVLAFVPFASKAQAPDKVTLRVKGEAGKSSRYTNQAEFAVEFQGETLKLNSEETTETKLVKVNPDGSIEFDLTVLTQKVKINGEDLPDDDEKKDGEDGSVYTVSNRGIIIATKEKGEPDPDDDSGKLNNRLSQATSMVFAEAAVGVGATWSHKFSANKDWGTLDATASFKLASFETLNDVKAAKIEFTYSETDSKGIKGSGIHWVELSSGDVIKSELKFERVPFDFGSDEDVTATLTGSGSRTSGSFVSGQSGLKPAETKPSETKPSEAKPAEAKPDEKKEEDKNSIDAKTKGWERFEGLFTLYRKVEESRTRHFLEVKRSQLSKLFMLQTTASAGDSSRLVAGDPVNDLVFSFEEMPNNKVFLKIPNYSWRAPASPEMAKVLQRSFSDSYVESFDIEGKQKDRDSLLIDISQFFLGNIAQISEKVQGGGGLASLLGGGGGSFSPDREKSLINSLKVFPENLYAEVTLAFSGRGTARGFEEVLGSNFPLTADPRGLTLKLAYHLFALPEEGSYLPRRADTRVGYFQTAYRDWSKPDQRDQVVQNVARWNLVKKDPKAALSEPVKPIVFWVDNAFPEKYRKTVAAAISSWNSAFEKLGFKNAVVVKQMPEKADFDHADVRYNVVRLVASPGDAYAVANARVNPLTGEILNAGITLDANFLRAISGEWEMVSPAEKASSTADVDGRLTHSAHTGSCITCDLQKLAGRNAAYGAAAILMTEGPAAKERLAQFSDEYLFSVIQHEMGHILGLRHNFVGSTQLTMAQLADAALVKKHNTSASVMDYVPFNVQALGRPQVPFFGRELGDYDNWAIRYGYTETGIKDPEADAKVLAPLAAQGSKWGLAYQSDEQAMSRLDPYVAQFDMAADPLSYFDAQSKLSHKLLMSLGARKPLYGQSFNEFTRSFNSLLSMYASSVLDASIFIGGVKRSFAKKGDPGSPMPFVPVSGADQRKALDLVVKGLFDERVFDFPKSYYQMFQGNPKAGFDESLMSSMEDYAVLDQIASFQSMALSSLLSSAKLSRVMNFHWKAAPADKALSVQEVFTKLGSAVWSEVNSPNAVSSLRRQLQRSYLDKLIELGVKQQNGRNDINLYAWAQLKEVYASLKKAASKDVTTQLHYAELKERAARALNSIETLGGSSSSAGGIDLSSLLGGSKPKTTKQPANAAAKSKR